jgi:methionyl-tRNA formyltransferase
MRIIFMGSPGFAVPTLDALANAGHEIVAAYCQPPRPANRGKALQPTSVQKRAEELGIIVRHPASLKAVEEQVAFAALDADVAVVAAYGLILPQPILDAPRLGCVNVHASLLPRWRGAAPIQRAILGGDEVTGVTIMQMEAGLDTGPMLIRRELTIDHKNAGQLTEELAELGATMMAEFLHDPAAYPRIPQPEDGATYAPKVTKTEARIDWSHTAESIERQVRAFAPAPGAWFTVGDERIKLLSTDTCDANGDSGRVLDEHLTIACGTGAIRPLLVQRSGRAAMRPDEFLRGFRVPCGTILR